MIAWRPALEDGPPPPPGLPPFAVERETGGSPAHGLLRELPVLLLVAALIVWPLKSHVAQAFYIPSPSMEPQLGINERVLVSKLSYRLHEPRRGDIVVFDCPPRASCPPPAEPGNVAIRVARAAGEAVGVVQPSTEEWIKRVIALPGETVQGRGGRVYVNGRLLVEPYLPRGTSTSEFGPERVPEGHLWVMGDNRGRSFDSRFVGPVARDKVVGRAVLKIWPPARASFL